MTTTTRGSFRKSAGSRLVQTAVATAFLLAVAAPSAHAQGKVELGASLASATKALGDDGFTTIGVPTDGFGLFNPGVYVSLFAGPKISIEPQLGLLVLSADSETEYVANFRTQLNYFIKGNAVSSPYLFGHFGILGGSDADSVKSYGGGLGYRFLAGDRLAFRLDGRLTHYTSDGDNSVAVGLSIGGLFGAR